MIHFIGKGIFWICFNQTDHVCWRLTLSGSIYIQILTKENGFIGVNGLNVGKIVHCLVDTILFHLMEKLSLPYI